MSVLSEVLRHMFGQPEYVRHRHNPWTRCATLNPVPATFTLVVNVGNLIDRAAVNSHWSLECLARSFNALLISNAHCAGSSGLPKKNQRHPISGWHPDKLAALIPAAWKHSVLSHDMIQSPASIQFVR